MGCHGPIRFFLFSNDGCLLLSIHFNPYFISVVVERIYILNCQKKIPFTLHSESVLSTSEIYYCTKQKISCVTIVSPNSFVMCGIKRRDVFSLKKHKRGLENVRQTVRQLLLLLQFCSDGSILVIKPESMYSD